MGKKVCTQCLIEKSFEQFHKNASRIDGYNYRCAECVRFYEKQLRKEKISETNSRWYRRNQLANPQDWQTKYWAQALRSKYNLSPENYELLLEIQDFKCAICRIEAPSLNFRLAVDHCHKTNKVRGLLCRPCNSGIGFLKENKNTFLAAIKYLKL